MPLINLPNEILLETAKYLLPSSTGSLSSLSVTCRDLHYLIAPLITAYFHKHKNTILLWAASRGLTHLVARLIEAGANVNHRHPPFLDCPTVLELAVDSGCLGTVELLVLNGVDVTPKPGVCFHGDSVVRKAVELKHYEMVKLLLEHGASPNEKSELGCMWDENEEDWCLWDEPTLHTAVRTNNPAMVRLLLMHGADPIAKDEACRTPLEAVYDSIWERQIMGEPDSEEWNEAIRSLIEAGGDADHVIDDLEIGDAGRLVTELGDDEEEGLEDEDNVDGEDSEREESEVEL